MQVTAALFRRDGQKVQSGLAAGNNKLHIGSFYERYVASHVSHREIETDGDIAVGNQPMYHIVHRLPKPFASANIGKLPHDECGDIA